MTVNTFNEIFLKSEKLKHFICLQMSRKLLKILMLHKCPMRKGNVDILSASTHCHVAILPLTDNQTENVYIKIEMKTN